MTFCYNATFSMNLPSLRGRRRTSLVVIPANAGIQLRVVAKAKLDPDFRQSDEREKAEGALFISSPSSGSTCRPSARAAEWHSARVWFSTFRRDPEAIEYFAKWLLGSSRDF